MSPAANALAASVGPPMPRSRDARAFSRPMAAGSKSRSSCVRDVLAAGRVAE